MSDDFRDDFDFDDDDDFNFDFDDDFDDSGDDLGGFDDFDDDVDLDDDPFGGFDEGDDDLAFIDDQAGESGGGRNRTFLLVAGLLVIILLAGVVLLVLAIGTGGDPSLDMTRTAIAEANETTEALIQATNAQGTANAEATQTATLFTATPSPTNTETPTETPDLTATAAIEQATETGVAILALTSDAEGTSIALTSAAGNITPTVDPNAGDDDTPTPTDDGAISPVLAAQQTATALAGLFNQTPTVDVTSGATTGTTTTTTTTGGATTTGDEMPDTGLFDEVGAENAGIFFLMAFGLVGVIVGSRRLRSLNKRKRR